ncbi:unnamed protein product [Effrenium voratum]|nr:unnamed protein product [Effrenium voratum]
MCEELAAADLHIILQDCVVEVYNRVPELVCDTGTVVFSVGLRWDFANHEMMKMERDHDVVMEILPENRRSLPTVMLDCRGIHDPDCGATLFGAMLCRMAEDNWRIVHYHSDSWRRMDCGGHCEMCNMTEANANNLIEMVESSFPKEQRNAPKPAAPRVSTPKPMLMKIQSKAKPQSVAKENPVKVPAVEEKNQEMEQLKAEVSRLAGMVKGLVEERDKARTLELGSAPWREFDSRESRKRKASSPETARDDSARSARGDTDFIGDVDPDRCGPGDFSARSTRPFEMSLQYNQRAQLQLTPKYWLQKFVENVTHDHEGWIGPYEIDQSKKEKPVKEMNYEMNIKYYLRVRGYGQSFRMPQEFIKRGWRKTVFARPKGGDHDEWRLLVQDVPAKMRVDYPKDSIAVDAHRADLVAIKKELDKGGACTVVVAIEYSDWSTSLNHSDIMDMVISHCELVWTSEFLDFLSEKAHEASAQDMLSVGFPVEMQEDEQEEAVTFDMPDDPDSDSQRDEVFNPVLKGNAEMAEWEVLDSIDIPDLPAKEQERRKAWRAIPQKVRVAVRRLHRQFGHPDIRQSWCRTEDYTIEEFWNAQPIYENYEVGDIVCFRRDFMGKTQWSQFPKVKSLVTRNRIVKDFEVTHQLVAVKSCDITSAYFQAATVATLKEANKTVELALERVISNPGRYRLCWCSDGSDCTLPSQYLSYAGILQIKWPTYSPERFFCELGQLCNISGIEGEGLGNNDKVMLLTKCGEGIPESATFLEGAMSVATFHDGTTFLLPASAQSVSYQVCWCPEENTCMQARDFSLALGRLDFGGPVPEVVYRCFEWEPCEIPELDGSSLQDGDRLLVVPDGTSCREMAPGTFQDGIPNSAVTEPATENGTRFTWGDGLVRAAPGHYALCWCSNCSENGPFPTPAGVLRVGSSKEFQFLELPRDRPERGADTQLSWLLAIPLPALFFGAICLGITRLHSRKARAEPEAPSVDGVVEYVDPQRQRTIIALEAREVAETRDNISKLVAQGGKEKFSVLALFGLFRTHFEALLERKAKKAWDKPMPRRLERQGTGLSTVSEVSHVSSLPMEPQMTEYSFGSNRDRPPTTHIPQPPRLDIRSFRSPTAIPGLVDIDIEVEEA